MALRRLAGVTQVVDPAEGQVFHNRLTHTLEVAYVGRRLADRLNSVYPNEAVACGGLDADVVEAAALIHDLGHPPFGHVAERTLDELLRQYGVADGYEGNAQSFRIVTRLSVRHEGRPGMNLTRGTLDASIKYPWFRQTAGRRQDKWGAYHQDEELFLWTRALHPFSTSGRSIEAEIMDLADDICFSVHDVEDFYRAGLIPLDRLAIDRAERDRFLAESRTRWERLKKDVSIWSDFVATCHELLGYLPVQEPFQGRHLQRVVLRSMTSSLVNRYINNVKLIPHQQWEKDRVEMAPPMQMELKVLKELTWHYVINSSALASQQYGKAKVIRDLFEIYMEAIKNNEWVTVLPERYTEQLNSQLEDEKKRPSGQSEQQIQARVVADAISGLTDLQATKIHHKLTGIDGGSLSDKL
jgi:dGTPase